MGAAARRERRLERNVGRTRMSSCVLVELALGGFFAFKHNAECFAQLGLGAQPRECKARVVGHGKRLRTPLVRLLVI